jgi:hypothetical protein
VLVLVLELELELALVLVLVLVLVLALALELARGALPTGCCRRRIPPTKSRSMRQSATTSRSTLLV